MPLLEHEASDKLYYTTSTILLEIPDYIRSKMAAFWLGIQFFANSILDMCLPYKDRACETQQPPRVQYLKQRRHRDRARRKRSHTTYFVTIFGLERDLHHIIMARYRCERDREDSDYEHWPAEKEDDDDDDVSVAPSNTSMDYFIAPRGNHRVLYRRKSADIKYTEKPEEVVYVAANEPPKEPIKKSKVQYIEKPEEYLYLSAKPKPKEPEKAVYVERREVSRRGKERRKSPEIWLGRTKAQVDDDKQIIAQRLAEPPAKLNSQMVWIVSDGSPPQQASIGSLRGERGDWRRYDNGDWYFRK